MLDPDESYNLADSIKTFGLLSFSNSILSLVNNNLDVNTFGWLCRGNCLVSFAISADLFFTVLIFRLLNMYLLVV